MNFIKLFIKIFFFFYKKAIILFTENIKFKRKEYKNDNEYKV